MAHHFFLQHLQCSSLQATNVEELLIKILAVFQTMTPDMLHNV